MQRRAHHSLCATALASGDAALVQRVLEKCHHRPQCRTWDLAWGPPPGARGGGGPAAQLAGELEAAARAVLGPLAGPMIASRVEGLEKRMQTRMQKRLDTHMKADMRVSMQTSLELDGTWIPPRVTHTSCPSHTLDLAHT